MHFNLKTSIFSSKIVQTATALIMCASLSAGTFLSASQFASAVQNIKEAEIQEETGGDDVHDYLSQIGMKRLSYEEPTTDIVLSYSASSEELIIYINDIEDVSIEGIPFNAVVTDADGNSETYTDDDMDGVIVISDPEPGDYEISLVPVDGYTLKETIIATVEAPVEHVQVDVSEKVIDSAAVDTSSEDIQYGGNTNTPSSEPIVTPVVEPVVTPQEPETPDTPSADNTDTGDNTQTSDTVEYVESRTEEIEEPVLSDDGQPLYASIVQLSEVQEDGYTYLLLNDEARTITGFRATANSDGTLATADQVNDDGSLMDIYDIVVDRYGKPIEDEYGNAVYAFSSVAAKTTTITMYYGWQTIDGKTYYYDKDGNAVKGSQTIQGVTYYFGTDGSIAKNVIGMDISYWNTITNWSKVKASGIDFVIIRAGFRGYTEGGLFKDSNFAENIAAAKAAGLKVGIYFFTQAITETEAVEEASLCLELLGGQSLDYPVFLDMEDLYQGQRNRSLSASQRTAILNAFCDTIRNAGYRAGVYCSYSYYYYELVPSSITSRTYKWVAYWPVSGGYPDEETIAENTAELEPVFDMWQLSEAGSVEGMYGAVDIDISFMG